MIKCFVLTLLTLSFFTHNYGMTHELELRRNTQMALSSINCDHELNHPELIRAKNLIQSIASRIMLANPEIFYGDLDPSQICIIPTATPSQRAWAESDKRLIRVEAGMLLRVRNEAQLAFVISHELAHLALRHEPLEGNPIPETMRERANQLLIERQTTFEQLLGAGKGNPQNELYQQNLQQVNHQINELFLQYFDEAFNANWLETEAEVAGAMYYLKAGYPKTELGWRLDQLVVGMHEAGLDPRTQNGGDNFDPHSPPGDYTTLQRTTKALRACGLNQSTAVPPRGTHRYAMPCWQIWNLKIHLPQTVNAYRQLYSQANLSSYQESPVILSQIKQDICALEEAAITTYCE